MFADWSDVQARWRPLSEDEQVRAGVLLASAERLVRLRVPSLDARVAAGTLDPALVGDVLSAMVIRVLAAGISGGAAVTQKSVTVGGITTATSFGAGASSGGLTLEDAELALLVPVGRRAFSVSLWPV